MKTNILHLTVILIFSICSSCEKDIVNIKYPNYGDYGENILQVNSINNKSSDDGINQFNYSLRAELPSNTSLKLIIKNKSIGSGSWGSSSSTRIGWSIDNYDIPNNLQRFFAYGPVVCDLKILFYSSGFAEIEFYENKDTIPTRIKTIYW